jgi:exosortase
MNQNSQPATSTMLSETALWGIILMAAALLYQNALYYMLGMWREPVYGGADYSHGPILPLVSLYALWHNREKLFKAPKQITGWGLTIVILALILHWAGFRSGFHRASLVSLLLFLWGCGLTLYGTAVARLLLFPVGYLVFCIPLNILDGLSFQLRMVAASLSTELLKGLGVAAQRAGTAIYSTAGGAFSFDVADPCSGIRSLLALTALSAAYAYFTQKSLFKKWILFVFSIPIAVAANVARITSIAIVAQMFGQDAALRVYHDFSGYIVFTVATLLLMSIGRLVGREWLTNKSVEAPL